MASKSVKTLHTPLAAHAASLTGNEAGASLLKTLGIKSISVNIPKNATLVQVNESLGTVLDAIGAAGHLQERLRPIAGRMMLEVKTRKLYKEAGHKTFMAWVKMEIINRAGISLTSAKDMIQIAARFPALDASAYQRIGFSRLLLASRQMSGVETDPKYDTDYMTKLEETTTKTVPQLQEEAKAFRVSNPPTGTAALPMIALRVPKEVVEAWQEEWQSSGLKPGEYFAQVLKMVLAMPKAKRPHAKGGQTQQKGAQAA